MENKTRDELEKQLLMRIGRLLKEFNAKAPKILVKNELSLIKSSCENLLEEYNREEKENEK